MKKKFIILFCLSFLFTTCNDYSIKLENSVDPDIVLVNIEDGDRGFIGEILQKLDSLNPLVVGINVTFKGRRKQDSALITAFKNLKNDILVYNVRQDGLINGSDSVFTKLTDQGDLYFEERMGLITTTIPLQKIKDSVYESFAYKVIKHWKPGFVSKIKVDERMDIHYTRNLEKFFRIDGSLLLSTNVADFDLPDKVFLVGYTGPGNEDKYFTPLRHIDGTYKNNEPDTYGLVIIANQIRTILEKNQQ